MTDEVNDSSSEPTIYPKDEGYFKQAADWDSDKRAAQDKRAKLYAALGISGIVVGVLGVLAAYTALPFVRHVPVVVRVDNNTGAYDVKATGDPLMIGDTKNEKILISDVTRYIKAREGFTRAEASENYRTVYLMSCGVIRSEWDNHYKPDLNPNSPVARLTNQDADRVSVDSVTFLKAFDDDHKLAQVQFSKTQLRGTQSPLRTKFMSTVTIKYEPKNVPSDQGAYYLNPFGFCVTNYRRDQVGNPVVLNAAGSPNQEFNQEMERLRRESDEARASLQLQQQTADAAKKAAQIGALNNPTPPASSTLVDLRNIGTTPATGLGQPDRTSPAASASPAGVPPAAPAPFTPAAPATPAPGASQ